MPEELRPSDEWVLVRLRRACSRRSATTAIFTSAKYEKTIGLVMGHTILAMGGKEHHDHRSLVAKAFRATALERWEPSVIGPVCDQLIDEIKNDGHADLVKALTFEFPTRIISALLGLPPEDLDLFRRLSLDLISIPTDIMAGLTAATELHGVLPGPGRAAAPQTSPTTSSATWSPPRSTARSSPTRPSSRSCACCCRPGWRPPTARRATCCTCC